MKYNIPLRLEPINSMQEWNERNNDLLRRMKKHNRKFRDNVCRRCIKTGLVKTRDLYGYYARGECWCDYIHKASARYFKEEINLILFAPMRLRQNPELKASQGEKATPELTPQAVRIKAQLKRGVSNLSPRNPGSFDVQKILAEEKNKPIGGWGFVKEKTKEGL